MGMARRRTKFLGLVSMTEWEQKYIKEHGGLPVKPRMMLLKFPAEIAWDYKTTQYRYLGEHNDLMLHTCPVGLEYARYCMTVCQFCKMTIYQGERRLCCDHDDKLYHAGVRMNYKDYRELVQQVMLYREKEKVRFSPAGLTDWEDEHGKWKDDNV